MKLEALTVEELKNGYQYDAQAESYQCLVCGKTFEDGEIFPMNGRFFQAKKAVMEHMQEHGSHFENLLSIQPKYNTLTENQLQIFRLMSQGMSDKDIAKELGVSQSTIRSQKFTFRERAKQAKLYLGIYETAVETKMGSGDMLIEIHDTAVQVDGRYHITQYEQEAIKVSVFETLEPLKLKAFPRKDKKKIVILMELAKQFEAGRKYAEKEVNAILKAIYPDFVTLRRALIEYGFMESTDNGSEYYLK
ncbi:MAG: DUF2087 domain-containing protein [Turicibacter sp.]|nr:DUF2087 domain-containing protein [Turicibacter sp.]